MKELSHQLRFTSLGNLRLEAPGPTSWVASNVMPVVGGKTYGTHGNFEGISPISMETATESRFVRMALICGIATP